MVENAGHASARQGVLTNPGKSEEDHLWKPFAAAVGLALLATPAFAGSVVTSKGIQ